jgi:hypothetical protein
VTIQKREKEPVSGFFGIMFQDLISLYFLFPGIACKKKSFTFAFWQGFRGSDWVKYVEKNALIKWALVSLERD